jgi:hypothetical protein
LKKLIDHVLAVSVAVSEFNLDMGLDVLLPEHLPTPVLEKLEFVHQLRTLLN